MCKCSELKRYGFVFVQGSSSKIRRSFLFARFLARKRRHVLLFDELQPSPYPRMPQRIHIVLRTIEAHAVVELRGRADFFAGFENSGLPVRGGYHRCYTRPSGACPHRNSMPHGGSCLLSETGYDLKAYRYAASIRCR